MKIQVYTDAVGEDRSLMDDVGSAKWDTNRMVWKEYGRRNTKSCGTIYEENVTCPCQKLFKKTCQQLSNLVFYTNRLMIASLQMEKESR